MIWVDSTDLEDGVVAGVGEVGEEVVDGASAGVLGLEPGSHDREHGEAAVLDLLSAQLLDLVWRAAAPAKRVKPQATRVPSLRFHVTQGNLLASRWSGPRDR
jgi:hypothetical protein